MQIVSSHSGLNIIDGRSWDEARCGGRRNTPRDEAVNERIRRRGKQDSKLVDEGNTCILWSSAGVCQHHPPTSGHLQHVHRSPRPSAETKIVCVFMRSVELQLIIK